jgi:hypothetical protein
MERKKITEMEKIGAGDTCRAKPNTSMEKNILLRSRMGKKKAIKSVNPTARKATEPEKVTKKLAHPDRKPKRGP